jgi:hypothetical protein
MVRYSPLAPTTPRDRGGGNSVGYEDVSISNWFRIKLSTNQESKKVSTNLRVRELGHLRPDGGHSINERAGSNPGLSVGRRHEGGVKQIGDFDH